ncbi:YwpF family protein [Metabacillus indicus]|uniref:YwpF family protein n=1 Tax=Metabacillus indicus TaxID=246786 RepID=UPI002A08B545|nr:YwpF family protein [Metabacillus indicus]MDX8289035.1 YwpF family protein [Metabacillus indicus]
MKTFRLVGLTIELEGENGASFDEISLSDGLIINKEDGENHWMIEALLPKEQNEYFELLSKQQDELRLYVTISKKTNKPAEIMANIKSIMVLEEHISVLFEGRMLARKSKSEPEKVLGDLLTKGIQGDELLHAFRQKLNEQREINTKKSPQP